MAYKNGHNGHRSSFRGLAGRYNAINLLGSGGPVGLYDGFTERRTSLRPAFDSSALSQKFSTGVRVNPLKALGMAVAAGVGIAFALRMVFRSNEH